MPEPKIILYTSYACPWAHRAQIALAELKVPFETVHIDLTVPRTAECMVRILAFLNYNYLLLLNRPKNKSTWCRSLVVIQQRGYH